ncbi:MAG: glycosyltransferase family 2 protein [Patescibacteria group bacterium]
MNISIVVPAHNEAEGIQTFHNKMLMPSIRKLSMGNYEVIYINDGSTDNTLDLLSQIASKNKHIKVVNFSRNFGKELAITAGIAEASGDAVIIMDSDGQHPPELIGDFVEKWLAGAQVVIGVRGDDKHEGIVKRYGSRFFYSLFNKLSGTKIVPRSTDYRLLDKQVREEFLKCDERQRITRGLIDWLGFRREFIDFSPHERIAGSASYSNKKLIKLALNSFTSLSLRPLIMLSWLGAGVVLLSLAIGMFVVVEQLILGDPLGLNITGSGLLGIFVTFLVGVILVSQGILAVYLSHMYEQSQARPLYIIDRSTSANL